MTLGSVVMKPLGISGMHFLTTKQMCKADKQSTHFLWNAMVPQIDPGASSGG